MLTYSLQNQLKGLSLDSSSQTTNLLRLQQQLPFNVVENKPTPTKAVIVANKQISRSRFKSHHLQLLFFSPLCTSKCTQRKRGAPTHPQVLVISSIFRSTRFSAPMPMISFICTRRRRRNSRPWWWEQLETGIYWGK